LDREWKDDRTGQGAIFSQPRGKRFGAFDRLRTLLKPVLANPGELTVKTEPARGGPLQGTILWCGAAGKTGPDWVLG